MSRSDEPFHPVSRPKHYNSHPSGVECIELARLMSFCTGNALKYVWRMGLKDGQTDLQELSKAQWYLRHALSDTPFIVTIDKAVRDERIRLMRLVSLHHETQIARMIEWLVVAENAPNLSQYLEDGNRALEWLNDYIAKKEPTH